MDKITFMCKEGNETWNGEITSLRNAGPYYEAEMTADGSYYILLFGKGRQGNYLCIPNWSIGMELAGLNDSFWNRERLDKVSDIQVSNKCSIIAGLEALSNYVEL